MKTLKTEEIYCTEYETLEELDRNLQVFLDTYCNHQRALGYLTPAEFEEQSAGAQGESAATAARMSFFRHEKSSAPIGSHEGGG